jgi:hypothetical protein
MFNRFSTYGSPVNIRFPQGFKLPPQDFILGILCRRSCSTILSAMARTYCNSCPSRTISAIFKIESDAALLRTFKITGATQFQIASAISKPSLVRTMISNRFRVSSVNL